MPVSVPCAIVQLSVSGPYAVPPDEKTSVTVTGSPMFEYSSTCHAVSGISVLTNGVAFAAK